MVKFSNEDFNQKIEELNQQMDHLAAILNMMVSKLDRIEKAAFQMRDDINNELNEFRDGIDIDDRET
jgi:uncharacterized coiled-coil DUF342 family protein